MRSTRIRRKYNKNISNKSEKRNYQVISTAESQKQVDKQRSGTKEPPPLSSRAREDLELYGRVIPEEQHTRCVHFQVPLSSFPPIPRRLCMPPPPTDDHASLLWHPEEAAKAGFDSNDVDDFLSEAAPCREDRALSALRVTGYDRVAALAVIRQETGSTASESTDEYLIEADNKSGFEGVRKLRNGNFRTGIRINRKNYYLETFKTAREASRVYTMAYKHGIENGKKLAKKIKKT